jgi:thermitase
MHFLSNWLRGLAVLGLLFGFGASVTSANSNSDQSNDFVPNEVLVKLNPSADRRAFMTANHLKLPEKGPAQLDNQPIYRFEITDGKSPLDKASKLKRDRRVVYAEPDYIGDLPEAQQRSSWVVGDAAEYAVQWAPAALRLPEAHTISRGAGIIVATLDTGVDVTHPALVDHLMPGYDFVDFDDDPSELLYSYGSAYGHGTHVAGLVALAAPDARIMPLRTLDPNGVGTIWTQALALRYAMNHGADVVNLSFSFKHRSVLLDNVLGELTCSPSVDADCRALTRPGAIVVAAAGNSGTNIPEYPAADLVPGVLAVGASTEENTLATFSTYGSWVRVAAPGERIVSTLPGGSYASWSGTSMATPLTAGVAALDRAAYPALRPKDVMMLIANTAAPLSGPVPWRVDAAATVGLGTIVSQ